MTSGTAAHGRMHGFSLLEVVVALAILALTMGALWQVVGSTVKRATTVQDVHRAVMLAESKVAELAGSDLTGPTFESGDIEASYRWHRRIERIGAANQGGSAPVFGVPYRVTVEVSWGGPGSHSGSNGDQPRAVVLTTVRLGAGQ